MRKGRVAVIPYGSRLSYEAIGPLAMAVRAAAQRVLKRTFAGGCWRTRNAPVFALEARGHRQQVANGDICLVRVGKRQTFWDEVIGRAVQVDSDGQAAAPAIIEQQAPGGSGECLGA